MGELLWAVQTVRLLVELHRLPLSSALLAFVGEDQAQVAALSGGDDYVLATGETTEVRRFCEWAFADAGLPIAFRGEGVEEKGYCQATGKCLVEIDPRYFRPAEVELLLGDPSRARDELGWQSSTSFDALVSEMVVNESVPAIFFVLPLFANVYWAEPEVNEPEFCKPPLIVMASLAVLFQLPVLLTVMSP